MSGNPNLLDGMANISREKNKKYKTKGSQPEQWLILLALNMIPFNPAIQLYMNTLFYSPPPFKTLFANNN